MRAFARSFTSEVALTEQQTTAQRLLALMDHLGIEAAHVATQVPGDIVELVETTAARVAGVVLIVPTRLDAGPFAGVADRLLMISGDKGLTVDTTGRAAARLPGAKRHVLADYEAAGWSDVVADRADEVTRTMVGFLEGSSARPPSAPISATGTFPSPSRGGVRGGGIGQCSAEDEATRYPPEMRSIASDEARRSPYPRPLPVKGRGEVDVSFSRGSPEGGEHGARMRAGEARPVAPTGEHAGLTWRLTGQGPPLLLLPFFLAPSQWEPAIMGLAQHFTVVEVGGSHIGGIAALEDRARAPTYRAMFRTLVELMAPGVEARILDVGCGSGALDRVLARQLGASARIVAADLNPFFLKEAQALAVKDGLAERIRFARASATELPYDDASFDCVFSITVLEECDADRAIAEMMRVVKPGGRIGIIVRAIDVPQWWNLDLPRALAAKVAVPPQSVAVGGVADCSLYARMRRAGLVDLKAFPSLITLDRPEGPIWRYREDAVLPQLTPDELIQWRTATAEARANGLLMQAHAMHAAVATKP